MVRYLLLGLLLLQGLVSGSIGRLWSDFGGWLMCVREVRGSVVLPPSIVAQPCYEVALCSEISGMHPTEPTRPSDSKNQNPHGMGLFALLREDFRTFDRGLFEPGLWVVWLHRFGNWRMGLPKLVRFPFSIIYRVAFRLLVLAFGIELGYTTRLGRRVRIWHHGGIFINAESIGDDVHIRQNVAVGIAKRGADGGLAVIGDRVDIYVGVCIAGRVNIGDDAVIGANTVIVSDVEAGATMIGNPARRMPSSRGREPAEAKAGRAAHK